MDILRELIALDRAAAERVENVRAEQAKLIDDIGRTAAESDQKQVELERRRLEELRADSVNRLAEKRSAAAQAQRSQTERLDSVFAERRSEWIADITGRITEV